MVAHRVVEHMRKLPVRGLAVFFAWRSVSSNHYLSGKSGRNRNIAGYCQIYLYIYRLGS